MTPSDIHILATKIKGLYGDHFPGFTPAMAQEWLSDLDHLDEAVVEQGLRRWARQHTVKPPSLDELLEQVAIVRDEGRLPRHPPSQGLPAVEPLQATRDAQDRNPERSDDDVTYGRLMTLLAERSIRPWCDSKGQEHPKLTMAQRGEQCLLWARKYDATNPQLAEDLRAAVRHFGGGGSMMYLATTHDNEKE